MVAAEAPTTAPGETVDMELENVIRRRRMVRSFSGRRVPDDVVRRIVGAAVRAPTAGNTDGWAVVALQGPSETAAFWDATTTAEWRERSQRWPGLSLAPLVLAVMTSPGRYLDRYAEADKAPSGLGRTPSAEHAGDPAPPGDPAHPRDPAHPGTPALREAASLAPAVPVGDPAEHAWPVPYWFVDAGQVVTHLLLAATDAALGACFLGNFRGETALLTTLGVPDGWRYVGAVLVGEPGAGDHRSASLARGRRQVDDVTHFGRW